MDSSTSPGPAPSTESAAHSEAITTNSGQGIGRPVEEGSDSNDQLSNYLSEVWKKVRKNWHPPKGMESRSCTVKFRIRRNGTIDSVSVVKSSGIEEVDEAAEDAVRSSSPLPVMPPEEGEDIDIKFSFDYNVYGSKTTKE